MFPSHDRTIGGTTIVSSSAATLYDSLSTTPEFGVVIRDEDGAIVKETTFNFSRASAKYARKVFNTNPTLVNTRITRTAQQKTYWLGPTFERELATVVTGAAQGIILGLDNGSNSASDFRFEFQAAQTPWIFSQDLSTDGTNFDILDNTRVTKLFKFHSLDSGEDVQQEVKISITNIKASSNRENPYGSFNVEVRSLRDSDNAPVILESFTSVDLNPASSNFIGRVIGTQRLVWDNDERRYRTYGDYPNASSS